MSYMKRYMDWVDSKGLPKHQWHVERYHKENPHMIPVNRDKKENAVRNKVNSYFDKQEALRRKVIKEETDA